MATTKIDRIKCEATALGKLLQLESNKCGAEEKERMQYLRTEILIHNIKTKK